MTTRQVAGPCWPPPLPRWCHRCATRYARRRPDRFTLKVSIDGECEQGLRQLKDLRSHLDPRMSWGDLVALLVREAVARHDPRRGGRRRGRNRTPAVVPPAARAGGGDGDTPAPQFAGASPADRPAAALVPQSVPSAPKSASRGVADGSGAALVPPSTPPAPQLPSGGPADGVEFAPLPARHSSGAGGDGRRAACAWSRRCEDRSIAAGHR